MTSKDSKYYILYKTKKDIYNNIIDLKYIYEFNSYNQIKNYLHCSYRDIKTMLNESYNDSLSIHKDYCIIKE